MSFTPQNAPGYNPSFLPGVPGNVLSTIQIHIEVKGTPIARGQNLRISEDYAQQFVSELGSLTGVEFVPGIARGTGSMECIWVKGMGIKRAIAAALGMKDGSWNSIDLRSLPDVTISPVTEDGHTLFTLTGVAIQSLARSLTVGNVTIAQDVSFGFLNLVEGDA